MASRSTRSRYSRPASLIATLALAACAAACSESGSAEKLAADAPLYVSTTPNMVTIHNRAGLPLTDLKIVVVPYGGVQFEKAFARFETAEQRDIPIGELRSSDGASLNLRFVKPRTVRVSARDVVGKAYSVEIPWQ
jgi:hypothetical protein